MVEVFKTTIDDPDQAAELVRIIHETFPIYRANFDLDDCDKILRICSDTPEIESAPLISLLIKHGFHAELLKDEIPHSTMESI